MNLGGLGARAALKQRPTKRCERCGLRYPKDEDRCTHCKNVSDSELAAFKEQIEAQRESGGRLGAIFLVMALALGVLLFLSL